MMKMLMVVYNEAIDQEVMEGVCGCGVINYTKVNGVYGKGRSSGTHLGTDIWPGRNNILYVACSEGEALKIMECVKVLRSKLGHEGVKAFLLPLEAVT